MGRRDDVAGRRFNRHSVPGLRRHNQLIIRPGKSLP